MTEQIVSKFGGTSNSDAAAVQRCVEQGGSSRVLVTSAPGALSDEQLANFPVQVDVPPEFLATKVTQQLETAHELYVQQGEIPGYLTDSVTARFQAIVTGLGINSLQGEWLRDIKPRVRAASQLGKDYASMLGEQLQAEMYQAMGWTLLDPARSPVALTSDAAWQLWAQQAVNPAKHSVLGGNMYLDNGRLYTFGHGGSDISGAKMSRAIGAEVYRNHSDTPALSADPKLIRDPRRRRIINHLTYLEGRDLGRSGNGLLHPEAIVPLMGTGIPTEIHNTFDPDGPFTLYTDEVDDERRAGQVMAISSMRDVSIITVRESGMSKSLGRIAALSGQLAADQVNLIDVEGNGSDSGLFIVEGSDHEAAERSLRVATNVSGQVATEACALVTLVGYKLRRQALEVHTQLRQNTSLGDLATATPYWFEGEHRLRFTVLAEAADQIVDEAHAQLIEC